MIHIATETFEKTKSGKVTGVIYLRIGSESFPEKDWNDFPVIILNWWLGKASSDIEGNYFFMDGPFSFRISSQSGQYIIEGHHNDRVIVSGLINVKDFKKELTSVAKEVLRKYKSDNPFFNSDVEIIKLKNYVKQSTTGAIW